MRLLSFAATTPQFEAGIKTETRRLGWKQVKPGEVLMAIDRSPRAGKGYRRLGPIEILAVRQERLDAITVEGVAAEGFPGHTPSWFIEMLCRIAPRQPRVRWHPSGITSTRMQPDDLVTVLSFRRLDRSAGKCEGEILRG